VLPMTPPHSGRVPNTDPHDESGSTRTRPLAADTGGRGVRDGSKVATATTWVMTLNDETEGCRDRSGWSSKSAFGAAEVARTKHGRMPLWLNDRVKLNEVGQAGRRGTHSSAPPSAFS
jgi:hypothetical protein